MGNNIDDIVNVGPTDGGLDNWQGVGRCGRDGRQGYAYMYTAQGKIRKILQYAKHEETHASFQGKA